MVPCQNCKNAIDFFISSPYVYLACYLQKQGQAPFDASAVDNMRRLLEHSGVPGHIYPLSLLCYEIMPPPQQVWLLATAHQFRYFCQTTSLKIFFLIE
jgi:hypothetical protein